MPTITLLQWVGTAAMGLVWGWMAGLWTAPPKIAYESFVPRSGALARRLFEWSQKHKRLRKIGRVILLLVLFTAPAAAVYLNAGLGPLFLFLGTAALSWWLHFAWREQLSTRSRSKGARRR